MESKVQTTKCIPPPDRISKKICFIMNNITEYNLKKQVDEVTSIMSHHFIQWLADSILKRIISEPNLHNLYAEFVILISGHYHNFGTYMLEILTKQIDYLLKLPILNTYNGKTLKYLGSFLGKLTIARNIPLCVDIKSLIYTAYKYKPNSLDYIIPFISEILKNTKYSYTIKPSDPWVKDILQVIKELHHITNKLSIQFEIELLFSYLQYDMNELNSAYYLRCK